MSPSDARQVMDTCPVATAAKQRHILDDGACGPAGAISAPVPPTVTNLSPNGDGTYSDQNANQWTYCATCSSPDDAAKVKGEWLQQIGSVQATYTTYTGVPYINGFEDLSMGPYVMASNNPPTAYKSYPSVEYTFFNVGHFWNRHLACYLASSQNQVIDAIDANFNSQLASHNFSGLYGQYTFSFNDPHGTFSIQYRVYHFPLVGDYLVGTAFIVPARPDC